MVEPPERILVTGYSGFVAPYVIAACMTHYPSAQVFGLVHHASTMSHQEPNIAVRSALTPVSPVIRATEMEGDITDGARMRDLLRTIRPDLIFHLAAVSNVAASWRDPSEVLRVNAGGFIQLAEAVRAENLTPRIVVSGSGEQYGLVRPSENPVTEETLTRPANPYAVSKVTQDQTAYIYYRAYGLDVVRARAFNHFGPGQSADFVVASFARQIALVEAGDAEPPLLVGNLSAQRDFLPVEEVAEAYVALAEHGRPGEAYNIGSGAAHSINSLLQMLLEIAAMKIDIHVDPQRFRPVEVPSLYAETTKIRRETGWQPSADIMRGLRNTLEYWRAVVQSKRSPTM